MTAALVALGAAFGAPLRYWLAQRLDDRFPLGIWLANVVGSTILGLLLGLDLGERPLALLGVGFCGAFTTFSTFAAQSVGLGRSRGTTYVLATVVVALCGCAAGYGIGALLA